jgi:membrane protein implicated in regulation of membrane protease activity
MEPWVIWVVAGFALIIAELLTGTFYLLVIGVAAFAGAVLAYMGPGIVTQGSVASAVALIGVFVVNRWHASQRKGDAGRANLLDRGQPVVLEGWVNETARIARVKYRGAWWDARLSRPEEHPAPGTTLYIEGQDGNMLLVASAPPAP